MSTHPISQSPPVPPIPAKPQPTKAHSVQFYSDDGFLADVVTRFIGTALGAGDAAVVIATAAHRHAIEKNLSGRGLDPAVASAQGRYVALDAAETLALFMDGRRINHARADQVLASVLQAAKAAAIGEPGSVAAFGEMVALLWAEGNTSAALELEDVWNGLIKKHSLALLCGYPLSAFNSESETAPFLEVCSRHSHVAPEESFLGLVSEDEKLREIAHLQQQSAALKSELERRKKAEEALRESEEFLSSIVQSSADCIKVLDLDGRIQYMSPPGQRALGISDVADVLGRSWVDFWPEEDRADAAAALALARRGEVARFEGYMATAQQDSAQAWDVQLGPMFGKNGAVERVIAISRNITDLKHAHAALMHSEKLAAAGRLAATIAHEINNPLEAITNLFYLLNRHPSLDREAQRYAHMCEQELDRVSHIVKQTLGFYRDSSRPAPVRVADVVRNALALQKKSIQTANVHVVEELYCKNDVIAYQGELRQVMLNLVANAIDAMPKGGTLRVRVKETRHPASGRRGVRVTIADSGSGIYPRDRARLFRPFFSTKAEKGTGLGLWVTKSIVEKHEGSLRFRSRVGRHSGTAFSVFLPAELTRLRADTTRSQPTRPASESAAAD